MGKVAKLSDHTEARESHYGEKLKKKEFKMEITCISLGGILLFAIFLPIIFRIYLGANMATLISGVISFAGIYTMAIATGLGIARSVRDKMIMYYEHEFYDTEIVLSVLPQAGIISVYVFVAATFFSMNFIADFIKWGVK